MVCKREKTSCIEPSGDVVPFAKVNQGLVGDGFHYLLEILEVSSPGYDCSRFRVRHYEIAESETFTYIFAQFVSQGFGGLEYESGSQFFCSFPHTFLGGLHQEGQGGVF